MRDNLINSKQNSQIYIISQMESQGYRKGKHKWNQPDFDFKSGKSLVTFINRIPNLQVVKFKLSEEQQDVVSDNNNLIVIGRSGTGKTTCALMRMFAIQILFKNLNAKSIFQSEGNSGKYFCKSEYLDYVTGLKTIFLTASPYLITQIKLRYQQLKGHVKLQLKNKEKARLMESQGQQKIDRVNKKDEEKNDLAKMGDREKQLNERKLKYTSFSILEDADYPGFFSIRQFLIMLDGSFMHSFYVRNNDRSRVQENDHGKTRRNELFKSYKVRLNGKELFALQCDWKIFNEYFWPTVSWKQILKRKRYNNEKYRQVTAIATWTQIISTIKGSCQAHTYEGMYLPLKQYLQQSKNNHFGKIQKQTMHELFLHYNQWKVKSKIPYYDVMDISNHILTLLKKLKDEEYSEKVMNEIFGELGQLPDFNYLFLDEVQDLPPAVIYLISFVFNNGVYYSGDTAQAIRKGVAFKFSDISLMFRKQSFIEPLEFKPPQKYSLTVNFRSHNQILEIANNIVRVIQLLFPGSIDSMKKQSAKNQGPRPILLNKKDQYFGNGQIVLNLLLDQKTKKFDPQQAIIVRNQESKKMLPKEFEDIGLVLTVEDCKGLQYNDVVVYNFFNPKLKQKWKILKYIDLYPKKGKRTFHLFQIDNISDYEELIVELKMLYTIFTRARCTLIIYDENVPEEFEHIWTSHNLVECQTYNPMIQEKIKQQIVQFKKSFLSSNDQTWQTKGWNFFCNKQYDLAISCYSRVGKEDVCTKIRAVQKQQIVEERLHVLELKYNIKGYYYQMDQDELEQIKQWKNFKNECINIIYPQFDYVGELFERIKLFENAADCYYQAENYEKALETYRKCDTIKNLQAGICCEKIAQIFTKQNKEQKYISEMVFQAANFYQKCSDYTRMMLCLEKNKHYQHCVDKLNECRNFHLRQYFYRKYTTILINKHYRSQIDRQPPSDMKIFKMSQAEQVNTFEKIVNLAACEGYISEAKKQLDILRRVEASKFKLFQIQKAILEEVNQSLMTIHSNKYKLEIIQRYRSQANIAVRILWHKIDNLASNIQKIKQNRKQMYKIDQMNTQRDKLQGKYYYLNQKLNKLYAKENYLAQQLWYNENETLGDKVIDKLNIFNSIIERIHYIRLFKTENMIFFFSSLYQNYNERQLRQRSIKETTAIIEQMNKKIINLKEEIREYIQTPVYQFSQLKIKKKKHASYDYLNKISKNGQETITKKRFLPPIPFITQLFNIIEQYENVLKSYCQHAFNNHKNQLKNPYQFEIYNQSEQSQSQNQPYKTFNKHSYLKQNEALIMIQENYLRNKIARTQYEKSNINEKINNGGEKTMKHSQLIECLMKKNLSEGKISIQDVYNLNQLALISPRSYLYLSNKMNLKQCVVQSILWHLSYKSTLYINKSFYGSSQKTSIKEKDAIINMLNPDYFNFEMARTKFKRGKASDQLIEGMLFLGFYQQVAAKLSKEEGSKLKLTYLKEQNTMKQYFKERKNIMDKIQKKKKEEQEKQEKQEKLKKEKEENELKNKKQQIAQIKVQQNNKQKQQSQQSDPEQNEENIQEVKQEKQDNNIKQKPSKRSQKKANKGKDRKNHKHKKGKKQKVSEVSELQTVKQENLNENNQQEEKSQIKQQIIQSEQQSNIMEKSVQAQKDKQQLLENNYVNSDYEKRMEISKIDQQLQICQQRNSINGSQDDIQTDKVQQKNVEQEQIAESQKLQQPNKQMKQISDHQIIQNHIKSKMNQNIAQNFQTLQEINQFLQMDKNHENSIFQKCPYINYQLTDQQIKGINTVKINKCQELTSRIKQLQSKQIQKLEQKTKEIMKIYEPMKFKILDDDFTKNNYSFDFRGLEPVQKFQQSVLKREQLKQGIDKTLDHINTLIFSIQQTIIQKELRKQENKYRDKMAIFDRKIGKIAHHKDYPKIYDDMDRIFNPFKQSEKETKQILEDIIDYLWNHKIIKYNQKKKQFQELKEEIIVEKKEVDKIQLAYVQIDKKILQQYRSMNKKLKNCQFKFKQILKKIKSIEWQLREKGKDYRYYEFEYQREEINKQKTEKKKRLYKQARQQVQRKMTNELKITSPLLRSIFFYENIQSIANHFIDSSNINLTLSHQQIVHTVMFYFVFENYKPFKDEIRQNISNTKFKIIEEKIKIIREMLECSLYNEHNLRYFAGVCQLCKLKLITKEPNMSIYEHFVLVNFNNEKQPLMRYIRNIQQPFMYYADQKRQIVLMKITDLLPIIEDKMKMNFTDNLNNSFLHTKVMSFKNQRRQFDFDKISDRIDKIVQKIQLNRCSLFAFMGNNAFISHQSSGFIYHQLKCYCDLLKLAGNEKVDLCLVKMIQNYINELELQFKSWMVYAEKFELPFRRGA